MFDPDEEPYDDLDDDDDVDDFTYSIDDPTYFSLRSDW